MRLVIALALFVMAADCARANAEIVSAAVAANFTAPAKEIAARFEAQTGAHVALSFAGSGQLYAQVAQGAPFDVLLSADSARAQKAIEDGLAIPGTQFTYAVGKLVLWSAAAGRVDPDGDVLKAGEFAHLSIANPKTAPYGAAAIETLAALGVLDAITPKLVTGENIAQAFQFVVSGNAELGFVALSQVINEPGGSRWLVPDTLYTPILQDAVLLKRGEQNAFARGFLSFLREPEAVEVIARYGYAIPAGQ